MSCKGCARRRAKLQAWFRRLLGIDEIITKQGEYFVKYVDSTYESAYKSTNAAHEKIGQLMEAGSALESGLSEFGMLMAQNASELSNKNTDLHERIMIIRTYILENQTECRKLNDGIVALRSRANEQEERLHKVEFPGFEPVVKPKG